MIIQHTNLFVLVWVMILLLERDCFIKLEKITYYARIIEYCAQKSFE